MITREDVALILRAGIVTEGLGHRLEPDFTYSPSMGGCWCRCERCGLRVLVMPSQGRVGGAAARLECGPARGRIEEQPEEDE